MKRNIVKRIILLITISIILTSILILWLGFSMSKDSILLIINHKDKSELAVVTNMTQQYIEGEISTQTYERILHDQETLESYLILNDNSDVILKSVNFPLDIIQEIQSDLSASNHKAFVNDDIHMFEYENNHLQISRSVIMKGNQVEGYVFITSPIYDYQEVISMFLESILITILIVVLFVTSATIFIFKRITKPISNVVNVALAVSEGDFSVVSDESLVGEIGFLSNTLNEMSKDLYLNVSHLYVEKKRLGHVLDSIEESILSVDKNLNITHVNNRLYNSFQLEPVEGNLQLSQIPLVSEMIDDLTEVLHHGHSIHDTVNYQGLIYSKTIHPIDNEKKEIVGAVLILRDITEHEKLELTRKNYVANVSHELRTPLTSIQGLIEPLLDGIVHDETDKERYYGIIYRETRRLSRLIDDIMELSRLQTSQIQIEKEKLKLDEILENVFEQYKMYTNDKLLVYECEALPFVYSNKDRIMQVLVILLDNAFKFTDAGDVITIDTKIQNQKILVSVSDTGNGIDSESIPHIFNRFYKSDTSRTTKSTGLGLSIANEILTIMHEQIYCRSELSKGTKFTFTLDIF